jgi:hypothetical protein
VRTDGRKKISLKSCFYFHHIWNILEDWFLSKIFEIFFLLKSCFLPIKSNKTWKKAIIFLPSVTCRRRRCRWLKFEPHLDLESWNFGSFWSFRPTWCLHSQNFKVQVHKGTPFCQRTVFMTWKWIYRVQKVWFSVARFILEWNFLNKTSNLNFTLGLVGK